MTFDPGPLADVTLHEDGDGWTLVFARDLRHSPDEVWRVLTDPERLREWAPFTADRDLGTPGAATLTMLDGDEPVDLPSEVRRAEAPTLLEYTWGGDVLRWDLAPNDTGTKLTLRHRVGEREMGLKVAAGWHLCVAVAERLLDGDPVGPIVGERAMEHGWQDLYDRYAERLGATAS